MPVKEAKCGNQAVDRLAYGSSPLTKICEISHRFDSQLLATSFENLELTKFAQDSNKCILISDSLQSLAENQVRQPKALPTELAIEVVGLFVLQAPEIVDPDRSINDDHRSLLCKSRETGLLEGFIPTDLASKPPNGGLHPCRFQQGQSFLDRGPLCP